MRTVNIDFTIAILDDTVEMANQLRTAIWQRGANNFSDNAKRRLAISALALANILEELQYTS